MAILDLCEKYFNTRDVYKLFQIEKTVPLKDIKKAYYKLSLQVHPDRCEESEKDIATEKFKILSKLYQVLSDKDQRALYDEKAVIDEEDDLETKLTSWLDLWRTIFKPLTVEDISNYERSYINSELERTDIKKAYLSGKGCINQIMDEVPFLGIKDEPRLQKILGEMIAAKEVPEYKIFTKEPAQKRNRRHKKLERQSKEAEKIKQQMDDKQKHESNLQTQIIGRQQARENSYNALMDKLIKKYGDEDESDVIDFGGLDKSTKKRKKPVRRNKDQTAESKLKTVKNGKVTKRK